MVLGARSKHSRKKPKKIKPIVFSARPATEIVDVHSPNLPGVIERLPRVVDSIEYLRKKFPTEHAAALRIRRSYDTITGSVGGAGDFDRVRGRGVPGQGPPRHYLDAGAVILDVEQQADHLGRRLITLVVCEGRTLMDISTARKQCEFFGLALRISLRSMADFWGWVDTVDRKIRGFSSPHSPQPSPAPVVRGKVVHATRNKIYAL